MPSNEKTWYGGVDFALPDCSTGTTTSKSILWSIKAALVGGLTYPTAGSTGAIPSTAFWTTFSSCDSVNFGNGDGVDHWGTTYAAGALVRGGAGTAHSWYVFRSPTALGPYYLCLDWGASDTFVNSYISKATPGGGTTTSAPTATDSTQVMSQQFAPLSAFNFGRFHFTIDASGNFMTFASKNGGAIIQGSIAVLTLTDLRLAGDTWPIVLICDYSDNGCYYAQGVFYANGSGGNIRSRSDNADTQTSLTAISLDVGAGVTIGAQMAGPFYADSSWEAIPVNIYSTTLNRRGLKGRIPDMRTVTPALNQGSRWPSTGAVLGVVAGNTLVPLMAPPTL